MPLALPYLHHHLLHLSPFIFFRRIIVIALITRLVPPFSKDLILLLLSYLRHLIPPLHYHSHPTPHRKASSQFFNLTHLLHLSSGHLGVKLAFEGTIARVVKKGALSHRLHHHTPLHLNQPQYPKLLLLALGNHYRRYPYLKFLRFKFKLLILYYSLL